MQRLEVRDHVAALAGRRTATLPAVSGLLGAGRQCQERIPLDPPIANVGRDKVALRPDVDLVAAVVVVVELQHGLSSEDGVPRVGAALAGETVRGRLLHLALVVHLRAHGGPDAVRAHQQVSLHASAVRKPHYHPVLVIGVAHHGVAVLDVIGLQLLALIHEDILKVRPINDASVGQLEKVSTLLQRKGNEPVSRHGLVKNVGRVGNISHAVGAV
mmetsp:Transcript_85391/g.242049  ORF Transcript_85391/g.242049 Transcript_85391/m.242049 type:complete len:215 (-) Transcript_85391:545-1189(-)